jgi:malic enzyme
MDNIIAIQDAVNNLEVTGAGAVQINCVKALVAKAIEQEHVHCDSQGRMYSRSTASRVASSVA